jgi:ubiquitin thioesterase OTU1
MKQMDTWGGAIELSILSDIYDIEISSIDVKASSRYSCASRAWSPNISQSLRIDRFGEGKVNRVIILYSGIHYDRIGFCMDLSYPVEVDVTRWSTEDDEVLEKALQLAQRLQSLHYYTDTTDFVIKCEICNWIGQGTREAAKHERETGHSQFGEMQITD